MRPTSTRFGSFGRLYSDGRSLIEPADEPPAITDPNNADEKWYERPRWREGREWGKLGVEILTLVVVVIYACVTIALWRVTENALTETRRSNEQTQRAYVLARRLEIIREQTPLLADPTRTKRKWGLRIIWGNWGHAPAILTAWGIHAMAAPPNPTCPWPALGATTEMSQTAIPQRESAFVTHGEHTEILLNQVLHGRSRDLTVYGIIRYTDPFQQTHHTRFCAFLLPFVNANNALSLSADTKRGPFGACLICNKYD